MLTADIEPVLCAHDAMHIIAGALAIELEAEPNIGLSLVINDILPVTVAPGRHDRIAVCFQIGLARQVSHDVWISAMSEAATWGLNGESQRFVVIDRYFALLWTPAPLSKTVLLERLYEVIAIAYAVAKLVVDHPLKTPQQILSRAAESVYS